MQNIRPHPDKVLLEIADYVADKAIHSDVAFDTARLALMDSIGCAVLALKFPACKKLLGPWVKGITIQNGVRVPATDYVLDPIKAAFDIGTMIRWLDYNDTWLAKEWGHPSDNLGALLSVMDYSCRTSDIKASYTVRDLCEAMIKAYEIQGILALENSFNAVGFDHVVLVKVASTALATKLLGGSKDQIIDALSQAWVDGQSLRTYRHAPNTGSRKSWAAGDATSRAVRLALLTLQGEQGYPSVLTASKWGFEASYFDGKPLKIAQPLDSYVMENILFKISYPAEFHAQTAVEVALNIHADIKNDLDNIEKITIYTQEAGKRIIDKQGPLHNPADRDHCIQYMVAVGLLMGDLKAEYYEDGFAKDPKIDNLRAKMEVIEEPAFTQAYFDPNKRAIPNKLHVQFKNGKQALSGESFYPVGHKSRRKEGVPLLLEKFSNNCNQVLPQKTEQWFELFNNADQLWDMPVDGLMQALSL